MLWLAIRNKTFALFEKSSFFSRLWLFPIFYPLHLIIKLIAYARRLKGRVCSRYQSKKTVVCVGNVLSGGTGKTPFILLLLESLNPKTRKIAVLSRGYQSLLEKKGATVACYYEGPLFSPEVMGDEPFLICQKFPSILCIVGKNRLQAIKMAEKEADLLLLDDGLQDLKIAPTFKVGMQGFASWGDSHFFLPLGRLRDVPFSTKDLDLVVTASSRKQEAKEVNIEVILTSYWDLKQQKEVFPKGSIAAFSSISQPQRFFESLKKNQFLLKDTLILADHQKISLDLLEKFWEKQKKKGVKFLLCTEKDALKLTFLSHLSFPVISVSSQIKFRSGELAYQLFIEKIVSRIHNCED